MKPSVNWFLADYYTMIMHDDNTSRFQFVLKIVNTKPSAVGREM